jgi:succinate dehydrogenase/fumarate reductase flavoprotein subunit
MAEEAGAALVHLDRQYNGYAGLPNALELDEQRGFPGGNGRSIWVNAEGRRFVTEGGVDRYVFPVVMRQQPKGHWSIFDEDDREGFGILSPHFVTAEGRDNVKIQRVFVDNPAVTQKADTIEGLAERIGVPPSALAETVRTFNEQVESGRSTEVDGLPYEDRPPEFRIDTPPFYATKLYPLANKSAGGISIDMGTRALDANGAPVPGLYAAGEVTGSAGMNGLNGLDGMFTGPSILTGRVAGQTVVADLKAAGDWSPAAFTRAAEMALPQPSGEWTASLGPEELRAMLTTSRDGYWHFERVHNLVLERGYACTDCHSSALPFEELTTREAKAAQTQVCETCHLAPAGLVAEGAQRRPLPQPTSR